MRERCRVLACRFRQWWSGRLFPASDPAPTHLPRTFWLGLLLVAGVAGFLLFPKLNYPLVEPDEGRYAEIGREMLRSGDWIVPRLNRQAYYDKPPLLDWLVGASLWAFGTHPWAARLVAAVAAFLTILTTFGFAARVFGVRAGVLTGLVLCLLAGFVQCGRFLIIDGVLTLLVACTLFAGYEAIRTGGFRRGWWVVSAICCALGVLAKGPVAVVLTAVPLAALVWLEAGLARIRLRHWIWFGGIVLILNAPWYVAMSIREPAFAREFLLEHHLLRFLGPCFHAEPFWFYLPVVLVACLPWSCLLGPLAHFFLTRSPAVQECRPRGLGLCVLAGGWCFLFFSLSRGKLPTYILPAAPALAILLGWFLDVALFQAVSAADFRWTRRRVPRFVLALLGVIWLAGTVLAIRRGLLPPGKQGWVIGEGVLCLGLAAAIIVARRRTAVSVAWALSAVAAFGFALELSHRFVPAWSRARSPLAGVGRLFEDRQAAVVCEGLGEEWGSVPFALDRDNAFLHIKGRTPEEIQDFLGRHPRGLLFVKEEAGPARIHALIPPGERIFRIIPSGKAEIVDIRPGLSMP